MSKYLYGAAVQGIQDFIFQTNKLREIVGASELVEQICTDAFDEFRQEGEDVVKAAGNIKYIFNDEGKCKDAVRRFPRKVMTMAPGITISQAVVDLSDNFSDAEFSEAIDRIESKLKEQRNKVFKSVTAGLMGIKRANNTGLPVEEIRKTKDKKGNDKVLFLDSATKAKIDNSSVLNELCNKSFGKYDGILAYDISEMKGQNDWMAIIHADGNGLGQVVQKVGRKKEKFRKFSQLLEDATEEAANIAYKQVIKGQYSKGEIIPARPVVLSGDDLTIIIRGDLAVGYAYEFIKAFEIKTKEKLSDILSEFHVFEEGKDYLTACAGIAFVKSSYPFYYGYELADKLCEQAKKDTKFIAKEGKPQKRINQDGKEELLNYLPASCLMFHKVQDSFITDYKDIIARELTASDGLSFMAGPYYTGPKAPKGKHTVEELFKCSKELTGENDEGIRSGIRNWISYRLKNKDIADQRRSRMLQVFYKIFTKEEEDEKNTVVRLTKETDSSFADKATKTCMAYDVLAYHTIQNQQTND